ncbi:MAG: hypothetical protein J7647_21165 [Cyanobacteria bacterium SBLK]|nr:hypothetical protein [Cyanobacteria bacterium SBLK]
MAIAIADLVARDSVTHHKIIVRRSPKLVIGFWRSPSLSQAANLRLR